MLGVRKVQSFGRSRSGGHRKEGPRAESGRSLCDSSGDMPDIESPPGRTLGPL